MFSSASDPVDDRHTNPTALMLRSSSRTPHAHAPTCSSPPLASADAVPPPSLAGAEQSSTSRHHRRPSCRRVRATSPCLAVPAPDAPATQDRGEVMQVLLSPNDRPRFEIPSTRHCQCVEQRASDHRVFLTARMRARRPPLPPQPSSHPLRRPSPTPSTPRLPPAPSTPRLSPAPSTPRPSRSPAPTSRLSARAVFSTSEVHRGRLALTPPPHPHLATATPSPARLACTTRPAFAPQAKSKMLTSCVSDRPSGHEDTHYDHLSGLRLAQALHTRAHATHVPARVAPC